MLGTYLCHTPAGCSGRQLLHYFDEMDYGYFGRQKKGSKVPCNFPLHKITASILLQYSTTDILSDAKDVEKLIPKLSGAKDLSVQKIHETPFNHIDFLWGIHASEIVYSKILNFFAKHQQNQMS